VSEPNPVIVVVEDEANIRRFIRMSLEAEGWQVFEADSLKRGLIEAGTRQPDKVVLDLGLPDGDGVDFIRDLRTWSEIPIIVLSARTTETDKVGALDAGADDYLTKPFGAAELLARVRAQLRRQSRSGSGATVFQFGKVRVDLGKRLAERLFDHASRRCPDAPPASQERMGALPCRRQPLRPRVHGHAAQENRG
jgi:two-component system KDP operon response regulator KdpE